MTLDKPAIDTHYDPCGEITHESCPVLEFDEYIDLCRQPGNDWHGDEFTLADFERYIEALAQEEDEFNQANLAHLA